MSSYIYLLELAHYSRFYVIRVTESKLSKAVRKFVFVEEDQVCTMKIFLKFDLEFQITYFIFKCQEKEDMAWQMAEMIIKDVLAITSGKKSPQPI
jgi:hypothetical protein